MGEVLFTASATLTRTSLQKPCYSCICLNAFGVSLPPVLASCSVPAPSRQIPLNDTCKARYTYAAHQTLFRKYARSSFLNEWNLSRLPPPLQLPPQLTPGFVSRTESNLLKRSMPDCVISEVGWGVGSKMYSFERVDFNLLAQKSHLENNRLFSKTPGKQDPKDSDYSRAGWVEVTCLPLPLFLAIGYTSGGWWEL